MKKKVPKRVMDITGIELTPGKPGVCLGNGETDFECCCDGCDYYLLCYPEFDPQKARKLSWKIKLAVRKLIKKNEE